MVKLRGRNRKEGSAGSGATTPAAVVMGGSNRMFRLPHLSRRPLLLLVLLIVVAGAGYYLYSLHQNNVKNAGVVHIPTQQDALHAELNKLLDSPPSANASPAQKAKYYDSVRKLQEDLGDYKAAVKTYEKRQLVGTGGLTYNDYYYVTQDYCKVSDKDGARAALALAKAATPTQDDPNNGYFVASSQRLLDKLSTECGL